jgi:ABC-type transport system involved in multi-copper enzyme maturation permease subunit
VTAEIVEDKTASSTGNLPAACLHLLGLTLRRQLFSRQTLVCLGLTVLCALIVVAWSYQRFPTTKKLAENVLMASYIGFLVPIFAISYGAAGIGGDREDRTLIYLLIVPIPRAVLYLTKALGTLLLVTAWTASSLALLCLLAGSYGREVFPVFLLPSLLGVSLYASLFLLLGATFRHGTIISLAYWFFLEVLFGAMPGIVKRLTVAYYMKCIIYESGQELKLAPVGRVARETFLAIPGPTAAWVMASAIVVLLAAGASVLSSREYAELG